MCERRWLRDACEGLRGGRAAALTGGAHEGAGGAMSRATLAGPLRSAQRGGSPPKAP